MSKGVRITLFLLALVGALVAVLVLLEVVPASEAKELVLRTGGVVAVGYLLMLVGTLLFSKRKQ